MQVPLKTQKNEKMDMQRVSSATGIRTQAPRVVGSTPTIHTFADEVYILQYTSGIKPCNPSLHAETQKCHSLISAQAHLELMSLHHRAYTCPESTTHTSNTMPDLPMDKEEKPHQTLSPASLLAEPGQLTPWQHT